MVRDEHGEEVWSDEDDKVQGIVLLRKGQESLPALKDLAIKIKELNERLQVIEGEADKLMLELLRDLFSGKHDPLKVIALKDLYELLEKVIDRCRDAGNVINHIVLKNS